MIHAFALEPQFVATWVIGEGFRFFRDKFGLGTPRVLLELPAFGEWKDAVWSAAAAHDPTVREWKRLEELFKLFSEHRCRRAESLYDAALTWLESAEKEHHRREFRAIVASENPRGHAAVVLGQDLGAPKARRWDCDRSATPRRSAQAIAATLAPMLLNCRLLHLIDPYFGPERPESIRTLKAVVSAMAGRDRPPDLVRIHCRAAPPLAFFEEEAARMAAWLPVGLTIEFCRWRQRAGGEKLHNRYVLTDLGGVSVGTGLDEGSEGETDDLHLLERGPYELRWSQYAGPSAAFERVDTPRAVVGTMSRRSPRNLERPA